MPPNNSLHRLLLLGGGHTHALLLLSLGKNPIPGVEITVVSDAPVAAYSGMVPAMVEGRFSKDEAHIDVERLAKRAGARFVLDTVQGLSPAEKTVASEQTGSLSADVISLNVGIASPTVPGVQNDARVVRIKPIGPFLEWLAVLEEEVQEKSLSLALVGGGAAGVELALALRKRFRERLAITLVEHGPEILGNYPARAQSIIRKKFEKASIHLRCNFPVEAWDQGMLRDNQSNTLAMDRVILTSGAELYPWAQASGLALSSRGFIEVDATLQSTSHEGIFAVGDVADLENAFRPKAGVFAVRQAQPLERNLRRYFLGEALCPMRLQERFLALLGTADGEAMLVKSETVMHGRWVRWLKDFIDLRFMRQFV